MANKGEVVNLSSGDIPGVCVSEGKIEKLTPSQLKFSLKARLHRRFLSRSRLQVQNRTCKPGAIFSAICRRDIAGVSNMSET